MKILAIEFSSAQRSVAVVIDGNVRGEATHKGERAVPSFEMISTALEQAKLRREEVDCIAIGLGPGSYTGVRAAIALAQGWQLARPVKLLGISSAECLAWDAHAIGWFGKLSIAIDAQRGEFYLAQYAISAAGCGEIEKLRLTSSEQAIRATAGHMVVGPDVERYFTNARELFPTAPSLGALAGKRTDFVPGEKLEPIYLRETNYVKAQPPRIARGD